MILHEPIMISEIIKKTAFPESFVAECEKKYEDVLKTLSESITKSASERPFILISGPSGSGKTTSGMKLEERLDRLGYETHILSLDNYFHPVTDEERPLFEANKLDLESPSRVDGDLLSSQLEDLMRGNKVELPTFDFVTNTRRKSGRTLKLHKGELVILEGIHSLNPSVIKDAEDFSSRIYVSVRSRIEYQKQGELFLLHPSKIRLARRMIRDGRTRNRTPSDTVAIYDSVERGENNYIMPYKHCADFNVDTFFAYELCAYKSLLPSSLPNDEKMHPWLTELFDVLAEIPTIPRELIPYESLIREFIGDGKYE